ncbi:hypothetical protein [Nocardia sp. NPDC057455]|uniref:hypothetical protein n=1 Tax=Nocardia sp. NPDC057455 TaxID=3346138 RepID=UPI00367020F4
MVDSARPASAGDAFKGRSELAAGVAGPKGDHLDVAPLRRSPVRIVPACGRATPRQVFDYKAAQELAALCGEPVVEFPGGHNGNLTHPTAYAARVCEIFGEPE